MDQEIYDGDGNPLSPGLYVNVRAISLDFHPSYYGDEIFHINESGEGLIARDSKGKEYNVRENVPKKCGVLGDGEGNLRASTLYPIDESIREILVQKLVDARERVPRLLKMLGAEEHTIKREVPFKPQESHYSSRISQVEDVFCNRTNAGDL